MIGFDKKLRELWEGSGMTQGAAAEALGVPHRTFVNWIHGTNKPSGLVQKTVIEQMEKMTKKDPA